jgi:hypothetical protein
MDIEPADPRRPRRQRAAKRHRRGGSRRLAVVKSKVRLAACHAERIGARGVSRSAAQFPHFSGIPLKRDRVNTDPPTCGAFHASPEEIAHVIDVLSRKILPGSRELGQPYLAVNSHWLSRLHASFKPWKVRQELLKSLRQYPEP